jgi:hypothetical protein
VTPGSILLAILANPPLTSGSRTSARVDLAAGLLGFSDSRIVNIFARSTRSTRDMSAVGVTSENWMVARSPLVGGLARADAVLLAYGMELPHGPARRHFLSQVDWLDQAIKESGKETWWVGGAPRHPSRWQRYTYRTHPRLLFPEALKASLTLRQSID